MDAFICRRDITPDGEIYLDGQISRNRPAEGVLDPLYATVLVLRHSQTLLCLVSTDLIDLPRAFSDEIMAAVSTATGIPPGNVIPSFTHTHSGPSFLMDPVWSYKYDPDATADYRESIVEAIADAAQQALASLQPVTAHIASWLVDGIYGNRNGLQLPEDKAVACLQLRQNNGAVLANLISFACHPTVLGPSNYLLSADIAGRIRLVAEESFGGTAFMLQGAAGDMGNRQYRQGENAAELDRVTTLLRQQLFMQPHWQPLPVEALLIGHTHYTVDITRHTEAVKAQLATTKSELAGQTNPDASKLLDSTRRWLEHLLQQPTQVQYIFDGWLLRLGSLVIVTVPCELSSALALSLKKQFPAYQLWVWGYVYYSNGYLVEAESYGKNFESQTSDFPAGGPEQYIEALIASLGEFLT